MHGGTDVVTAGFLLDGWRDDGRMGDAGLVEAVWRRGHHVRGESAGHQAEGGGKGATFLTGHSLEQCTSVEPDGVGEKI